MRTLLGLVCVASLSACMATDDTSVVEKKGSKVPNVPFYTLFGNDNFIEADLVKGKVCGQLFFNVTSPDADQLAIWTVGVNAVLTDVPYPTDSRPNFYGIFVPSNDLLNHHVDGFDEFDHYHIAERASHNKHDVLWDPFIVNPGPNFDAATWEPVTTIEEMNDAIAAGVLAPPVSMIDAGFGPIVFHGEIQCGHKLEKLYRKNGGR